MERLFHFPLFRKMSQIQGKEGLFPNEHTALLRQTATSVFTRKPHSHPRQGAASQLADEERS